MNDQGGTMFNHEEYREELADYAASRLDASRAADVERHLGDCDECRSSASFMKELGVAINDAGEALFEPHPDVADLRRYSMGEATHDADRIARHLEVCPSCDLETSAWPTMRAMENGRAGDSVIPGPWLRRVIGPWLAAAAGLVLGVALTIQMMPQRSGAVEGESLGGPAQHLMIPGVVRGSAPDLKFTLSADARPVVLDLQPVIPGQAMDDDEFRLTIRSLGAPTWSATATAAEMRRAIDGTGVVTFVVPERVLSTGGHEVVLAPAGAGSAPIFRAEIEIQRN